MRVRRGGFDVSMRKRVSVCTCAVELCVRQASLDVCLYVCLFKGECACLGG